MAKYQPAGVSYIISRNRHKRPTLMHRIGRNGFTACGVDTQGWSMNWFTKPIGPLLCIRCKRLGG